MTTEFGTLSDIVRCLVLAKVDAYRAATRSTDSFVSRSALNESEFVARLRRGENVTLDKLRRLEAWLSHHPAVAAHVSAIHHLSAPSALPSQVR